MEIKLKLSNEEHKDLVAYCNLNDLLVSEVVKNSFITGFNIERYGLLNSKEEKIIEKEIIKEKRVEIPVEIVKEVVKIEYVEVEKPIEVFKEVPVEKIIIQEIIKEIPIEKIVNNCDEEEVKRLKIRIEELENREPEIIEKIIEIPKEIVIEKPINSDYDKKIDALQNTVQKLKQDNIDKDKKIKEYEKTISDIQKFQEDKKVMYLRGSNLDDKLYK